MKILKLFVLAVSPIIIGYLFSWFGIGAILMSIFFLIYWGFVGFKSVDYTKSIWEAIIKGNT